MNKLLSIIAGVALAASTAFAQPYNVRGSFNGWGETQMDDDGDGTYSKTIPGMAGGSDQFFKIAFNDWAQSWPGSDAKVKADALGNITFHFHPGPVADGWSPGGDRVGYDDTHQITWEIQGAFNGWDESIDTAARQMTDMGGGLYSVNYTIAVAGTYDFKFRQTNSWDVSIGGDFGNASGNAQVTTTLPNEVVLFQLDLPNGRWRAIPEPMTLTLVGSAVGIMALRRRYRRA